MAHTFFSSCAKNETVPHQYDGSMKEGKVAPSIPPFLFIPAMRDDCQLRCQVPECIFNPTICYHWSFTVVEVRSCNISKRAMCGGLWCSPYPSYKHSSCMTLMSIINCQLCTWISLTLGYRYEFRFNVLMNCWVWRLKHSDVWTMLVGYYLKFHLL